MRQGTIAAGGHVIVTNASLRFYYSPMILGNEGDTLTEAFIRAIPNEAQQEACNALNRRTEFRVLRTTYGLFDKPVAKE